MMDRTEPVARVLVFGWGNPSRGDDALGPLFVEQLLAQLDGFGAAVECLTDFQLQVEHALDLAGRQRVLFVDASLNASAPYEVSTLQAALDANVTTHAMSPAAVMHTYHRLYGQAPPPCTLLAIRGEHFALGEPPSAAALANLAQALAWCWSWLAGVEPRPECDERS